MTETTVPRSASSDPTAPPYASPVDYDTYGLYGPGRGFNQGTSFQRPVYRFQGRIIAPTWTTCATGAAGRSVSTAAPTR